MANTTSPRAHSAATVIAALVAFAVTSPCWADDMQRMRLSFGASIQKALPSVVGIQVLSAEPIEETSPFFNHPAVTNGGEPAKTRTRTVGSTGSGVIVAATKDTGLILTNFHVIEGAVRIGVRLTDGRAFEARLIGRDAATDIAVLSVDAPDLVPVRFGSNKAQVGDVVLAIGAPFGLDATATMGMISNLFRATVHYRNFEGYIQHDASINPGNSGGALLNVHGELIGINTAIKSPSGGSVGLAFAQPAGLAIKIAEQILKYGQVRRGDIGISSTDVTPRIAADKKLDVMQGAVLTRISPGSSAEKAGLKAGDVIVETGVLRNERFLGAGDPVVMVPIVSQRGLETVLGIHGVGDKLKVKYHRGTQAELADVEFAPLPSQIERFEAPEQLSRLRGLVVTEIGPQNDKFGEVSGVLVVEAKPRSMSEFSGFLPGDIITHVRSRNIRKPEDLFEMAAGGDEVPEIRLVRGSTPLRFKLPY